MSWSRLDLGVGLVVTGGVDLLWPQLDGLVDVLEVEPQTMWGGGQRIEPAALAWLRSRRLPLLCHGVGFPVGGTVAPDPNGVAASASSAADLDAVHWSEHLAFNRARTRDGIRHAGYLLPPVPTAGTVDAAVAHIADFQQRYDRPFLVETPVNYLRPVPGDLSDGAFVAAIAERADCGILLDLHNIWANELNGRQRVDDFLAEIPLERVREVHLAGGHHLDDIYLDAHIGPVPEPLLQIAARVIPTLPRVRAILFEAIAESMAQLGPDGLAGVLDDLRRLAALPAVPTPAPSAGGPACTNHDGAAREAALAGYATRADAGAGEPDPGAVALRTLTDHARLSLLVATRAPHLRALLERHGRQGTDRLLEGFLASTPASAWPAEQTAAFDTWWNRLGAGVTPEPAR